ncbi:MAG: lipase [Myxococcota bacterium]|jgi:lipase
MTASNPPSEPTLHRLEANGIELAAFEWRAELRGALPTVLMVHATGFHARVWGDVIERLGPRHVISVDQRGHGRSENVMIDDWAAVGRDLEAVIDHFDITGAIGVGHSMGSVAVVDAAAARPEAFQRILLIDPVIMPPETYTMSAADSWHVDPDKGENHPTAKRKNAFASADAMIERFRDRVPYSAFTAKALRDYCEYGLLPAEEGEGFVLACPPAIEASVYMTSRSHPEIYARIRAVSVPVMILRAMSRKKGNDVIDFRYSPTWPGLVNEFPDAREHHLQSHTHFMPMEDPELVARFVLDYDVQL